MMSFCAEQSEHCRCYLFYNPQTIPHLFFALMNMWSQAKLFARLAVPVCSADSAPWHPVQGVLLLWASLLTQVTLRNLH